MKNDYTLASLAAEQSGYLSHEQATTHGIGPGGISRRLEAGLWLPVRRGLYRVTGAVDDFNGLLRGAVAYLPDATVSHEAAAQLHAIPTVPRGRPVVTVHAQTTHTFPDVAIHRSLDLFEDHRGFINHLPVTTPARTLVDLAAVRSPRMLAMAVDESLASNLVTLDELEITLDHVARRGRTGVVSMRKLIEVRKGSPVRLASKLERIGFELFEEGGLEPPVWQYPAPWNPRKRIDFAWPKHCVGCECDSRRWHTRLDDFQIDRDRDNLALVHRWRIFRFTWEDFTKRPSMVLDQLRTAMVA